MEGFRTLVRGWLGKLLMAILTLPFVLFGVGSYFSGGTNKTGVAAEVGKEDIYQTDLEKNVEEQRTKLLAKVNNNPDLIDDKALHQQALDGLIAQNVLIAQAQHLGLAMTDAQLTQEIQKAPPFQKDGKFSNDLFQGYLRSQGTDKASLFKQLRDQSALTLLAQGIGGTGVTSNAEIDRIVALQSEKRDVALANILAAPYINQIPISDAQINSYYLAHKTDLNSTEQVNLDYIVFDSSALTSQITVSEDEIQARYQAMVQSLAGNEQRHAQHILVSTDKRSDADAKKKIESLAAQIKAGADFGALAKANSDDAGSAANNGDLGFAGRGTYVPEFEKTLYALQPNQVSEPIKTQFGYHIIKLLEVKKADVPALESVRTQLTSEAHQAKLETAYSDALNQINEQAASSDNLLDLAKAHNLSITHSGLLTRAGGIGDFANKDLLSSAFSDDITKDRKVSSGIAISPTRTMWIQATQYLPVKPLSLAEATPKIRAALQLQGAMTLARNKATQIATQLNAGKTLADVSQTQQVTFQSMGSVGRQGGLPTPAITQAAFGLPAPVAGRVSATTVDTPDSVTVVSVSQVTNNPSPLTPAERTQIQTQLGSLHGQFELDDYVAYLKGQTKIQKFNQPKKADKAE